MPRITTLTTLFAATWREWRLRPVQRVVLVVGAAVIDTLVLFLTAYAFDRWRKFVPDSDLVSLRYLLGPVVVCPPVFFLSFLSTMHRGLAELDPRAPDARRVVAALVRLAAVLAFADCWLWPLALAVGAGVATALRWYPDYGAAVGWALAWTATRIWLGAPESSIVEGHFGVRVALRRSRARGWARGSLAPTHLLCAVMGIVAAFEFSDTNTNLTVFFFAILQLIVSIDAASSAAWHKLGPRERSFEDVARVFR